MKLRRITTSDAKEYTFVEGLLTEAFPSDEYRDLGQMREYTDSNDRFSVYLIIDSDEYAGFITIWNFEGFIYVEHFAILPSMRNRQLGSRVLAYVDAMVNKSVVLEVEEPEDDLTRRRIGFYQRNGFELLPEEYRQPAYRADSASLPMRIMVKEKSAKNLSMNSIKAALYKHVYGVDDEQAC